MLARRGLFSLAAYDWAAPCLRVDTLEAALFQRLAERLSGVGELMLPTGLVYANS